MAASRPLPPVYRGAPTEMRCVERSLAAVRDHGYAHHIQRLMVLGNLALLAGVRPLDLVDWMWGSFVDGAEWVMLPNVLGMALYARHILLFLSLIFPLSHLARIALSSLLSLARSLGQSVFFYFFSPLPRT